MTSKISAYVLAAFVVALLITAGVRSVSHPPIAEGATSPTSLSLNLGDLYVVSGHSMDPTLLDRDFAIVQPGKARPAVGQVIVFRDPLEEELKIHRVVEVGDDDRGWWARTKGDNNTEADWLYVRESNLIGVAKGKFKLW